MTANTHLQYHRPSYDIALDKNAIKFRLISDSVIVSMEVEKEDKHKEYLCVRLLNRIWDLSNELIGLDIIIRGGISYGELYDDGDRIFGKALVEAVKLEKDACFPRIILSEKFIEFIEFKNSEVIGNPGYPIEIDSEGVHQITIFGHLIFYANMYVHHKSEMDGKYVKEYMEGYRKKIEIGIENSDCMISKKYKKLEEQYISALATIEQIMGKLN